MPIIRRVFGPFHPEEQTGADPQLRWHFHGIRDDHRVAHWLLVYEVLARNYRASNIPINDTLIGRSRLALASQGISPDAIKHPIDPDMFLDGRPVFQGTITSILKSQLPASEIARATAASILRRT